MDIIKYSPNDSLEIEYNLVAAIGYFDGVHRGHQKLLNVAIEQAKLHHDCKSAMISFSPSPESVLRDTPEILLSVYDEKISLAEAMGINLLIIVEFNRGLASLSANDFYYQVISKLNVIKLICGDDFRYGYQGQGSIATLKKNPQIELVIVEDQEYESKRISSSRIKEELSVGNIIKANAMLGYQYKLSGEVGHGSAKGRTIGFPTANIKLPSNKFIPEMGVYVAEVVISDQSYRSTVSIGNNPTFNQQDHIVVEAYIHEFDDVIYGESIDVYLLLQLRKQIKFAGVEQLVAQMKQDVNKTDEYYKDVVNKNEAI